MACCLVFVKLCMYQIMNTKKKHIDWTIQTPTFYQFILLSGDFLAILAYRNIPNGILINSQCDPRRLRVNKVTIGVTPANIYMNRLIRNEISRDMAKPTK